ncbi:acyl carrier protein [Nocardia sp. CNY236]|uniref:acyl carrier protein n=1 Tax=Nocardia sp. CNY236 TaxID=1169152 RepID=UPI00040321E9|nr:acyl carrier protein [Nocardia sp. CNY236]
MKESDAVGERIRAMFAQGLQVADIDLDTPLLDYGLDSVRSVELVIELEREFGITISDEEASTLHTARDVIASVTAKMAHDQRAGAGARA